MKKIAIFAIVLCAVFIFSVGLIRAETISAVPEKTINISNAGHVTIKGAQVQQLAGRSFFTRVYWGDVFLRVLIRTGANTKFTRYSGGLADLSDIHEGDYLNIEGDLTTSASTLDVTASSVQNWSLKTDQSKFTGNITLLNEGRDGFSMLQKDGQTISVHLGTNAVISKGKLNIPFDRLRVGDNVVFASGVFNLTNSNLEADAVKIYSDRSVFWPKNFFGTFKSVAGGTLPTTAIVTIGGVDYTVYLTASSQVWNNLKAPTAISRYLPGDSIRIYGAIRESLDPIIDAKIIRNINL